MMFQSIRNLLLVICLAFSSLLLFSPVLAASSSHLKHIAIANYGPHASLEETITGFKAELTALGYQENKNIRYEVLNINFDHTLMAQMLAKVQAGKPDLVLTISTPVTQAAKHRIKDIPIVFADITDPQAAGLANTQDYGTQANMTGSSDKQNLPAVLKFIKKILPNAKTVGVLYGTGEDNDVALVKMLERAVKAEQMKLVAIPIDNARDIPVRMQAFKNKVDCIYVGVSGPIQPSLPAIVASANQMKIPVFNADVTAVKNHQVLASFAVSYNHVGVNAARIADKILKGQAPSTIKISYPTLGDHQAYISARVAKQLDIALPGNINNITVVP